MLQCTRIHTQNGWRERMKRFLVVASMLLWIPVQLVGQSQPWVSAYYAAWMQTYLPPSAIDFAAVTHIMHFSLSPSGTGVSGTGNGITASTARAITAAAHAAGKEVIVTIGGVGDDGAFVNSTNATNRAAFIASLVNFAVTNNYDGIDIDWEPITNASQYKLFIAELRTAMDAAKSGMVLTTAILGGSRECATVAAVQTSLDQINIMTYDMSGAWEGWVTWHNSPIYDGGYRFASTGALIPSANGEINTAIAAGITKEKLGIGTDFYGYVWTGVSLPRQAWTSTPSVTDNVPYYQLMNTYGTSPVLWDSLAAAAYISITSGTQKFVSLDNEQTMSAKAQYIRDKGIGGLIIWELGGGYRSSQPAGQRDKLLQAVKLAFTQTDVQRDNAMPERFSLEQNYPNPFNPRTIIRYSVGKVGGQPSTISTVKLVVYDLLGREVRVLVDEQKAPGTYQTEFDATHLSSGVYIYRLTAGSAVESRRMLLLK
jgi:chitinase